MKLRDTAIAGTMESSDIMITVEPNESVIEIDLDSTVVKQFGNEIRRVITETLTDLGVEGARIKAVDKGALDCTIRARVKTAVYRSVGENSYPWGGEKR